MTGIPRLNFPLFDEVAGVLRRKGLTIANPADHDRAIYPDIESWPGFEAGDPARCPAFDHERSMAWDLRMIFEDDGIAMLPGWERSGGARTERLVAEEIGCPVWLVAYSTLEGYTLVRDTQRRLARPQLKENGDGKPQRFIG